ncbi:uncharacterized protein LOC129610118 [Condylostylus longicornis]|uniref:uncharacterized protein LOC129610118 n=1 Tax=Condylostylus longicornis TaxID=2530218 RepID=UPI00244E2782|nr:uncharacterized protein LOC129610118 [Condylostylus longicornis]
MNSKWEAKYDFNKNAKSYECPKKGIKKEVVSFNYQSMTKPTEISRCLVIIDDIKNLNNRESNYLSAKLKTEFWIELGSAVTALDYYVEIILQQMFQNETSRCYIKTKAGEEITFIIKLIKIDFKGYIFELNLKDAYELSKKYKENGVLMFKKYPKFAQEYFCRAAKILLSYGPFDDLSEENDGVEAELLKKLLQNLKLNISACLIKEQRYEEVVFLTSFVEENSENIDKAIYRRALALHNLKEFKKAKEVIEKSKTFRKNAELVNLHTKILNDWKTNDHNYKNVVRKMFS